MNQLVKKPITGMKGLPGSAELPARPRNGCSPGRNAITAIKVLDSRRRFCTDRYR